MCFFSAVGVKGRSGWVSRSCVEEGGIFLKVVDGCTGLLADAADVLRI